MGLPAVEHALHAVDLAATHQAVLVLRGAGDLVQVARGLHRCVLGDERPFVLCDPRRRDTNAGAPLESHKTAMAALGAATGGSVCMRSKRLPRDFAELVAVLRAPGAPVQLILCGLRLPDRLELVLAPDPDPRPVDAAARARPDHRRVCPRRRARPRDFESVHGGGPRLGANARRDVAVRDREGYMAEAGAAQIRGTLTDGMSLAQFKAWLLRGLRLTRDGTERGAPLVVLARADFVAAMNPTMVAASETVTDGATFHFVLDPAVACSEYAPRTQPCKPFIPITLGRVGASRRAS